MTDNEFWTLIYDTLNAALTTAGISSNLVDSFQPDQQGAPEYPLTLFSSVSSRRYGWQGRKDSFNEANDNFDHVETYTLERVIQVSSWVKQDPADLNQATAFDITEKIAAILQSESVIMSLLAEGVDIIRITDIQNTVFTDERDDFTENPSFDFTVTYTQTLTSTVPKVSDSEAEVKHV